MISDLIGMNINAPLPTQAEILGTIVIVFGIALVVLCLWGLAWIATKRNLG